MKKIFLTTVLSAILALPLLAQNKTAEEKARKMSDEMRTELSLDDGQYEAVYNANLNYTRVTDKNQMDAARRTRDEEMRRVLNDDQYMQYQEMESDRTRMKKMDKDDKDKTRKDKMRDSDMK